MNTRLLSTGLLSAALLSGAAVWAVAQPSGHSPASAKAAGNEKDEPDEEVIDLAKAPEGVRTAAIKLAGSEKAIKKVIKEEDEEVYTYEVEYTADGVDCSAVFSTTGDLMELEKSATEAKVPAAVLAALKKDYPGATFKDLNAVQKFFYEIDVVIDGKTHEVKVDAAGNIEDKHDAKDEHEEHGKGKEREKGDKDERDDD
jgi:hypothetical protein